MATPREQPHGNPRHGGLGWVEDNLIWNGVRWSKKKNIFALDWGGNGLDSWPLAGLPGQPRPVPREPTNVYLVTYDVEPG